MRLLLSICILFTTMLTPALAALPQQEFFDIKSLNIENLSTINSIGLLEVPNLGNYAIRRGDIGLEIFVGDYIDDTLRPIEYDKKSKEYSGYNFSEIVESTLKKELQLENYKIAQFSAERNNKNKFLVNYDGLNSEEVDAYLDVVPQILGYYRRDRELIDGVIYDSPPFYLYVSVIVQLVAADTKQVLYRDKITYRSSTKTSLGRMSSTSGTVIFSPDDRQFKNSRELKENMKLAFDQIAGRIETVMQEIAKKISKAAVSEPDQPVEATEIKLAALSDLSSAEPLVTVTELTISSVVDTIDVQTLLKKQVKNWAKSWNDKDFQTYINFYSANHRHSFKTHIAWVEHRRNRIMRPGAIKVRVSNIEIREQDENRVIINFKQTYDSPHYSDKVLKSLDFRRFGSAWKISEENVISVL
jgi:hypothetical protein